MRVTRKAYGPANGRNNKKNSTPRRIGHVYKYVCVYTAQVNCTHGWCTSTVHGLLYRRIIYSSPYHRKAVDIFKLHFSTLSSPRFADERKISDGTYGREIVRIGVEENICFEIVMLEKCFYIKRN